MPDSTNVKSSQNAPDARKSSGRFKRVGQVLNRVMNKLGLDKRLAENTLMNLWPVLVGQPWADKSRCLFIDSESNLLISVADAATGQELSLMKSQILRKVRSAAQSMNLDIKGLRFDLKRFHERPPQSLPDIRLSEKTLPDPTEADLMAVELSGEDVATIAQLKAGLQEGNTDSNYAGVSSQRILSVFEIELKLRNWRRLHGYPNCSACCLPTAALYGESVCAVCFYGS